MFLGDNVCEVALAARVEEDEIVCGHIILDAAKRDIFIEEKVVPKSLCFFFEPPTFLFSYFCETFNRTFSSRKKKTLKMYLAINKPTQNPHSDNSISNAQIVTANKSPSLVCREGRGILLKTPSPNRHCKNRLRDSRERKSAMATHKFIAARAQKRERERQNEVACAQPLNDSINRATPHIDTSVALLSQKNHTQLSVDVESSFFSFSRKR